jgi:hypothetical protein
MSHVLAILTIHTDNLPENFQDIIKHEKEVVAAWKAEGFFGTIVSSSNQKRSNINLQEFN